jgi:hypothetical protein
VLCFSVINYNNAYKYVNLCLVMIGHIAWTDNGDDGK